ncbi:putative solute-binding protein [Bacterioplanoides sp.]|uniref:putative solute-binding protein n=1 Tax=Bacterioplanoides sp. TaxID=2066072 RepID=UPI003B5C3696
MRILIAIMALISSLPTLANEAGKQVFCIFDPVGARGPVYSAMLDYQTQALEWGANLELKAYTNEAVVVADFQAGHCDAMGVTGTRVRPYNPFTASIEALGGLNDYKEMQQLLGMLTKPKASRYMVQGDYEVAAILPGGAVYIFVRDKQIDSVEAAAGKRIATLDYDKASVNVVEHVGATMVPSTVATFAPRFNNGDVDIAYAPAVAYQPFEMYKGLGDKGGIYKFSMAQMNFQMIIRHDKFPEGFGQKSREYTYQHFDKALEHIRKAEADIPAKYWLNISADKETDYKEMLRQIRMKLSNKKIYDKRMMKLMFKLRCRSNPSHYECAERQEG